MCLGIPGKILSIYIEGGLRMGKVDFGGVVREACLEAVPEAKTGDYTIVHAGFALSLYTEEEAQNTLIILNELAAFVEEQDDLSSQVI